MAVKTKNNTEKKCLIILGMHRSGTSAMAGALTKCGLYLGNNLMPGNYFNPKGFFEDLNIVSIHEKILKRLNLSWDHVGDIEPKDRKRISTDYKERLISYLRKEFTNHPLFGFKDPRTSRVLFLWKEALKDISYKPYFLIMVREPGEVCRSLDTRNGFDPLLTLTLWAKEYLCSEKETRGLNRLYIPYKSLIKNPVQTIRKIDKTFDLSLDLSEKGQEKILEHIDTSLNRSKNKKREKDKRLPSLNVMFTSLKKLIKSDNKNNINGLIKSGEEAVKKLNRQITERCQEVLKAPKVTFQVFPDYGDGFSEKDSTRIRYLKNNFAEIHQTLETKKDMKRIRINIANQPGNIRHMKMTVRVNGNKVYDFTNKPGGKIKMVKIKYLPRLKSLLCLSQSSHVIFPMRLSGKNKISIDAKFLFQDKMEDFCLHAKAAERVSKFPGSIV